LQTQQLARQRENCQCQQYRKRIVRGLSGRLGATGNAAKKIVDEYALARSARRCESYFLKQATAE
jgi:hypothetical protein